MQTYARTCSYSLLNWYVDRQDAHEIVYRPTLAALISRLKYPAAVLAIGIGLLYLLEETRSLVANPAAIRNAAYAALAVLGLLSLLPIGSSLIEEVRITRTGQEMLAIRKRGLWTSTFLFPLSPDSVMSVCARESLGRTRRRGPLYSRGYTWTVTLAAKPAIHTVGIACLNFDLDFQRMRPLDNRSLPARVRESADALGSICGLPVDTQPAIIDAQRIGRGWGTRRRIALPSVSVSRHDVSIEELPEDVQAKVRSMIDSARSQGASGITQEVTLKQEFKVLGSDGRMQTYNSIEELPPDVRETIERLRHQRENR